MTIRTKIILGVTLLATLVTLFAFGPRPALTGKIAHQQPPAALAQLQAWVAAQEARFDDIVPGTEKLIIWHTPEAPRQTAVAVLYLHGFSATRREITPVSENLGQRLGANVYLTRLPGHGRGSAPMGAATVNDWAAETLAALEVAKKLGRKVIVISTSTGSTLSTWLMQQPGVRQFVKAQIYVSPNFGVRPAGAGLLTMPWAKQIVPLILGRERGFEPGNDLHARYWTSRYPVFALSQMQAAVDWVDNNDVSRIDVPTLFIYSQKDRAVDPRITDEVFDRWGGQKARLLLDGTPGGSHHVIVGDIVAPQNNTPVLERIGTFLDTIDTDLPCKALGSRP